MTVTTGAAGAGTVVAGETELEMGVTVAWAWTATAAERVAMMVANCILTDFGTLKEERDVCCAEEILESRIWTC